MRIVLAFPTLAFDHAIHTLPHTFTLHVPSNHSRAPVAPPPFPLPSLLRTRLPSAPDTLPVIGVFSSVLSVLSVLCVAFR